METGHTRDGPTNTRGGPTIGKGPRRMSAQTANPCNIGEDPQSIPGNDNAADSAMQFCGPSSPENSSCARQRRQNRARRQSSRSTRSHSFRIRVKLVGLADNGLRARLVEDVLFGRFSQLSDDDRYDLSPSGVRVPPKPPTLKDGAAAPIPEAPKEMAAVS